MGNPNYYVSVYKIKDPRQTWIARVTTGLPKSGMEARL